MAMMFQTVFAEDATRAKSALFSVWLRDRDVYQMFFVQMNKTYWNAVTFSHPQECRNFPPGFRRYPLLGNIPSMSFVSRIMVDAAEAARANSKFSPFMGYLLGPSER